MATMTTQAILPPNTVVRNGQLFRRLTALMDGEDRRILRPVALSLDEARKEGSDFYDHGLKSWIRGGVKREMEHPLVEAGVRNLFIEDDTEDEADQADESADV